MLNRCPTCAVDVEPNLPSIRTTVAIDAISGLLARWCSSPFKLLETAPEPTYLRGYTLMARVSAAPNLSRPKVPQIDAD
jgi:hypothetical protein